MKEPTRRPEMTSLTVSPLHIERGRQMHQIVQHDIVTKGYTFQQSVEQLSQFLGIEKESVLLGISLVNEVESGGSLVQVTT
jgi:hypothetical protein